MSNTSSIHWPLAVSSFSIWDKLRIGFFLIKEPIWTYGEWVKKYEDMWVKKFGCKYAIMVSSGSSANELIALRRKWELQQAGEWPKRNRVVFPVNTWISSVSVWINLGFEPVFVDVCAGNLNVTPEILSDALDKDIDDQIGTVFYTALLGYFNDIEICKELTEKHKARFLMDNCEASFSYYYKVRDISSSSILTLTTCSTSVFFSHFTSSGTEGGLIFTNSEEESEWYRMARSHGLTRGMPDKYRNPNVGPEFDFYLLGSNYRSSNLQAYMATLDFERAYKFSMEGRRALFSEINNNLDFTKYHWFGSSVSNASDFEQSVPLAIPILCKTKEQRIKLEKYLKSRGVMTRPIIGGILLAHTAFKGYGSVNDYPVAQWAHECGLYIGLHNKVSLRMAEVLVEEINLL